MKKFEDNPVLFKSHFDECRKKEVPYIIIRKCRIYSKVEIDMIVVSDEICNYINKNTNDNGWIKTFIRKLKLDGGNEKYLNPRLGRTFWHTSVKNEYAELLANFLFDVYMEKIREYKKLRGYKKLQMEDQKNE